MKIGLRAVAAMKRHGLIAAGFALVGMVVGAFTAGPAIAQAVRAALVSNVDDPGRIPYRLSGGCNYDGTGNNCSFTLPKVPDGKRVVITHISGRVDENLPGGTQIHVSVLNRTTVQLPVTFIGSLGGLNTFVFDQQVLFFILAGENAIADVELGTVPNRDSSMEFDFSGYMLDCNAGPCTAIAP